MKLFLIFSVIFSSFFASLHANTVIISPGGPPVFYDFYQPYNGPMRGPNSLEGKKRLQQQLQPQYYRYPYYPGFYSVP
jgi:hypothetical protein